MEAAAFDVGIDSTGDGPRVTRGPSADEWLLYKEEIIDLYRTRCLADVMSEMRSRHKFHASKRMYDTRFNQWKISKNIKRSEKEKIARRLLENGSFEKTARDTSITKTEYRKVMRFVKAQQREAQKMKKSANSPSSEPSPAKSQGETPGCTDEPVCKDEPPVGSASDQRLSSIPSLSPSEFGDDTVSVIFGSADTPVTDSLQDISSPSEAYPIVPYHSLDPRLLTFNDTSRNGELLIHTITNYFDMRISQLPLKSTFPAAVDIGTVPDAQGFWSNVENVVYLWKTSLYSNINNSNRAQSAIIQAYQLVSSSLINEPLDFLRRVLLILSPTNTSINLPFRKRMLTLLTHAAYAMFGASHPLTRVCQGLKRDENCPALSRTALHAMYDVSSRQLGCSHPMSYTLMGSIVTLTRRSGELDSAKRLADGAVDLARIDHGLSSDVTRSAAAELAHILTKLGEHDRACALRLEIATHPPQEFLDGKDAVHYRDDRLAANAMEDLAEYFDNTGDLGESLQWLKRAQDAALTTGRSNITKLHIQDKIDSIRLRMGASMVAPKIYQM